MHLLIHLIALLQHPLLLTACTIFHQELSWGDLLGSITGIINVYLMTRQNIWAWPIGIVNVLIYALLLPHSGLLANGILQLIYLLQSIYGWYIWHQDRPSIAQLASNSTTPPLNLSTGEKTLSSDSVFCDKPQQDYEINRISLRQGITLLIIGIILTIAIIALLDIYAPSDTIFFDGSLTAASLVTTYLETKRYLEAWMLWIIIDTIYIPVYIHQNLYFTSVFSAVLVGLATYGLTSWLIKLKGNSTQATKSSP